MGLEGNHWCPLCLWEFGTSAELVEHEKQVHRELLPAPKYYTVAGRDLYALFIEKYGVECWCKHVEMEAVQYLWRAREKGDYKETIQKVLRICQRILTEVGEHE